MIGDQIHYWTGRLCEKCRNSEKCRSVAWCRSCKRHFLIAEMEARNARREAGIHNLWFSCHISVNHGAYRQDEQGSEYYCLRCWSRMNSRLESSRSVYRSPYNILTRIHSANTMCVYLYIWMKRSYRSSALVCYR